MPRSLRFAEIILAVALLISIVVPLVLLASGIAIVVPLVVLMALTALISVYALGRTILGLERGDAWAAKAAFWGLCLLVLAGVLDIISSAAGGVISIPVLGILALIGIVVMPADARAFRSTDPARHVPPGVVIAYIAILLLTILGSGTSTI
jgi:hypothetical protein